jgi:predicted XRE-type DNA-binding protein
MATRPVSAALRRQLRDRILSRMEELKLNHSQAAKMLALTPSQVSRLAEGEDVFTLDRLIDAASRVGLNIRLSATRPYRNVYLPTPDIEGRRPRR